MSDQRSPSLRVKLIPPAMLVKLSLLLVAAEFKVAMRPPKAGSAICESAVALLTLLSEPMPSSM